MTYTVLFVIALFAIAFFAFLIRGCKDAFSRLVLLLFGSYWIVSLIGSQFQIQGLFLPKESTIWICLAGVLFFTLGFLCVRIPTSSLSLYKPSILKESIDKVLNSVPFKVTLIIVALFVISQDILMYEVIFVKAAMSGSELRGSVFSEESFYSPLFLFARDVFFSWYIPIIRALLCYSLFFKRNWFTIVMFVLLFGYTVLDAGRFGFVRALIPLIAVIGLFQFAKGKVFLLKKQKIVLWTVLGVAFIFIFLTSALRNSGNRFTNAIQDGWDATTTQMVSYSIGPIVAFDYQINSDFVRSIGGYRYGSISLWPFTTPYFRLQTPYKGINPNFVRFREESEKNRIVIGTNLIWNGLYTWNLNFYSDGGLWGIILLNFLFGFLMRLCIKWTYEQKTVYSFILCTIILSFVVQSALKLFDYTVLDPVFFIALIVLSKTVSSKSFRTKRIAFH